MRRILTTLTIVVLCTQTFALIITSPDYQSEVYTTYSTAVYGRSYDFCFGPNGEIYATHFRSRHAHDGYIVKIDGAKNDTVFTSSVSSPFNIKYSSGGAYGNYFYVGDPDTPSGGEITQVDLNGNVSTFTSNINDPSRLAIDPTGNYGNLMYATGGIDDRIQAISPAGSTESVLNSYWYGHSESMHSIKFDEGTKYDGKMFLTAHYHEDAYQGLFQVNPDGSQVQWHQIDAACGLMIDQSDGLFNGTMFFSGAYDGEWWKLWKVNGINDVEPIALFEESWTMMHLGPDGAMYAMEWNDTTNETIITKITPVPEPVTLSLLGLGALMLRKKS